MNTNYTPGQGASAATSAKSTAPRTTASKVNLAFTGLSFRLLTEQPGRARQVIPHASVVAFLLLRWAINSRRLGTCGRGEVAIAEYRVICVVRRADGHPKAVGYSANGNAVMYDDLWTIGEAREALEQGHRLYTVSPSTGAEAELEVTATGIRTKPEQTTDNNLDDLPPCGG